jgi:cation transport ATPase
MNAEPNTPAPALDCRPEETAAYLDGELDEAAATRFERHAIACRVCAHALTEQRRLLCLLDAAFGDKLREPALPHNFTRVVQARAEADMGQVRQRCERRRALLACLALAVLACTLLGARALSQVFAPARFVVRTLLAALYMIGHMLAETGRGADVLLRALGEQLTGGPVALRLLMFVGLSGAIVLLLRLINRYHRTSLPD